MRPSSAAAILFSRREMRFERYSSIEQVPLTVWESLASRSAVGLEAAHLRATEESGINALNPWYLIAYSGSEAVGIAYAFAMDLDLTRLVTEEPPEVMAAVKAWKPGFMHCRILEVGHIASIGATIEVGCEDREAFLQALATELDEIAALEGAELGIIRDLEAESYPTYRVLEERGYRPTMGFPLARLELEWDGFEGYVAALKSKKRYQVLQAQRALQAPEISVEIIEDYAPHADRLAALWQQVADKHGEYEHEVLTRDWFAAMGEHTRGRSHVIAIRLHGKIVCFGLALIGDDCYFGAAEGLDYSVGDGYELYANMLLETIRAAADLGKKTVDLGITTYDFKASLGAELVPTVYLIKAFQKPELSAGWAKLLGEGIEQPDNPHRAFTSTDVSARVQPRQASEVLRSTWDRRDVFGKHDRYARADMTRAAGVYAYGPVFESAQEPLVERDGREVIMLGTNAYLGLATHPRVKAAACAAIDKYGSGCSGSPLLNGTLDLHEKLRERLASFVGKEDALVCSTGYQTNLGVVSTLVGRGDVVLMDERSHASLIDGACLSRATLARYRHGDMDSLAEMLQKHADRPTLVVSDSLFSMEGTVVDLPAMVSLVRQHGARLMLDESHAIGVMGPTGRGVAEHYGLSDEVDVIMGTLSKSLASIGGFVAGERRLMDALRHTARSHMFSASLPPGSVAAALEALALVDLEPERRLRLLANARFLFRGLRELGYQVSHHGSAIVPLYCGNELLMMALFHRLLDDGVFVNPVPWPAVPKGGELLRLSVMATHDEAMLQQAIDVFAKVRTPHWPAA